MNDGMANAEAAYLEEPEEEKWCECSTRLRSDGSCPHCDAPDHNSDDEVDRMLK